MYEQLKVGSLFSGIGGFDLGLERAGMRTVWFCEVDEFCQRVLARHWPSVPCYPDVQELRGVDVESVDVLCGGFPCQDISSAGDGVGLSGARSGLWREFARLVGELRPRYVLVENVPPLRKRGLDQVLEDLDACGYDAEWDGISASAVGAAHTRDRLWLVAYSTWDAALGVQASPGAERERAGTSGIPGRAGEMANANCESVVGSPVAWAQRHPWIAEPDVGRVADGVPDGVDRLRSLGNALVPQIAEWIGRRILEWEVGRV